jgi:hypothetical protein
LERSSNVPKTRLACNFSVMSDEPIKEIAQASLTTRVSIQPPGQKGTGSPIKPGWAGGPGRPKGSSNKLKADLSQMVMNAAMRTGFIQVVDGVRVGSGIDGCEGYLMSAAIHESRTFLALLARILPYYVQTEIPTKNTLSYDETVAQLRERGLPPELINHLRKAPEANELWSGENDDPYGPPQPGYDLGSGTSTARIAAFLKSDLTPPDHGPTGGLDVGSSRLVQLTAMPVHYCPVKC